MPSTNLALGFGCFWFGLKGGRSAEPFSGDFDPRQHLQSVKAALSRIPNITNVYIDYNDKTIAYGYGNPVSLTDISRDHSFFPAYVFVKIFFGIYLPKRIQNQLARYPEEAPVETENFNVAIVYDDPVPYTVVYYETKSKEPNPSHGVVVVRKYLEQEFKDDLATFCSLGPSPLHADFMLTASQPEAQRGEAKYIVQDVSQGDGYKRFVITYADQPKATISSILSGFVKYIGPFLSSYYSLERDRVNLMVLSEDAAMQLQVLLDIENRRGFQRIYYQIRRSSRIISGMLTAMAKIEIEKARSNNAFLERTREGQLLEGTPFYIFIERVRAENAAFPLFPPTEVRQIVLMFEGRRLKLTENLAVLAAGILGGIVGALLTWAVAMHVDHPATTGQPSATPAAPVKHSS